MATHFADPARLGPDRFGEFAARRGVALSRFWTALVPAISATLLAGTLAVMLARRTGFPRRPAVLALAWAALLIAAAGLSGRAGLGTALTAAFLLQVTPSVWTAYRPGPCERASCTGSARPGGRPPVLSHQPGPGDQEGPA